MICTACHKNLEFIEVVRADDQKPFCRDCADYWLTPLDLSKRNIRYYKRRLTEAEMERLTKTGEAPPLE